MKLRLLALLVIPLWLWPVSLLADFEAGVDAYNRKDYATAYREWLPLAEQGNASAQNSLGAMYAKGEGVPQDYAEALKWFRLAAEQRDAEAQHSLGVMYGNGRGVPRDYVQAYAWLSLAAAQGNKDAVKNREIARDRLTPAQVAESKKLSRELFEKLKK